MKLINHKYIVVFNMHKSKPQKNW